MVSAMLWMSPVFLKTTHTDPSKTNTEYYFIASQLSSASNPPNSPTILVNCKVETKVYHHTNIKQMVKSNQNHIFAPFREPHFSKTRKKPDVQRKGNIIILYILEKKTKGWESKKRKRTSRTKQKKKTYK